ncbi:tyrosine-type recombinase/integrase [Nonomuraea sp. NPDC059023]|uniref:tyrosine-type recombinase/integrase n=1 Tax=unclassified Nonomuraea TaxID=2593643 RepID=UPI003683DF11
MSTLRQRAQEYLALRRALGYKLADNERLLGQFLDHLEHAGLDMITTEAAVAWATLPARAKPLYWRRRLSVVRGFARHLNALDPTCPVPPPGLLACFPNRVAPHLFSEQEILALMSAADRVFRQPLRIATYRLLIGLLAVTGMRTGEAVRLDREHLDLDAGILAIVDSKYGKSRQVLLHSSTVTALRDYARLRDQVAGVVGAPAFLVSTKGRLQVNTVDYTFATLIKAANIATPPAGRAPRPTDLRHTFAVTTLLRWYRAGLDVQARLPALSTWLGHLSPASTYWYLQAAPELLALAAERLDHPVPSTPAGALSWPRSRPSWKRSSPTG